jgi:hypothetical protein
VRREDDPDASSVNAREFLLPTEFIDWHVRGGEVGESTAERTIMELKISDELKPALGSTSASRVPQMERPLSAAEAEMTGRGLRVRRSVQACVQACGMA